MRQPARFAIGLWLAMNVACASTRATAPGPATRERPAFAMLAPPSPSSSEETVPELFVRCADEASCPSAVGMLIVDAGEAEPERCTATLIDSDRILTASHCLAASTRRPGAACPRTWISFPRTAGIEAEQVACARVEYASAAIDMSALAQDHAVLKLVRAVARTPLAIDPTPPVPGSIVTVASVTPHPIYGTTHLLTTRLCRAIDATLARAELGDPAANVGWLSSCPIAHGNSGSPVLDYELDVRAIVHGGTHPTSAFGVTSSPRP